MLHEYIVVVFVVVVVVEDEKGLLHKN